MNFKYKLKFIPTALKEWRKLDLSIQAQFKKKLSERLDNPHVPASQLRGFARHYKIKLRATSYRLVYEVLDKEICVMVIAAGKRDKDGVYKKAGKGTRADRVLDGVCKPRSFSLHLLPGDNKHNRSPQETISLVDWHRDGSHILYA